MPKIYSEELVIKNKKKHFKSPNLRDISLGKVVDLMTYKKYASMQNESKVLLVSIDDALIEQVIEVFGSDKVIVSRDVICFSKELSSYSNAVAIIDNDLEWLDGSELYSLIRKKFKVLPNTYY